MEGSSTNESLWSATLPNAPQLLPNADTPELINYLWSNITTFVSGKLEPGNSTNLGFANWPGARVQPKGPHLSP